MRPLRRSFIAALSLVGSHSGFAQSLACVGRIVERQRQKQPLCRHELVARLVGKFFDGIEKSRRFRRDVNLTRSAGHLRLLGERPFDGLQRRLGIAAGARDEAARQPFRVVEKDLQKMFGCDLLVIFAKR